MSFLELVWIVSSCLKFLHIVLLSQIVSNCFDHDDRLVHHDYYERLDLLGTLSHLVHLDNLVCDHVNNLDYRNLLDFFLSSLSNGLKVCSCLIEEK